MRPPRISFGLIFLVNVGLALLGGPWAWINVGTAGLILGMLIVMEAVHHYDKRS